MEIASKVVQLEWPEDRFRIRSASDEEGRRGSCNRHLNESHKRRITLEDHVELTHLVASHAVVGVGEPAGGCHVSVDAANYGAGAFQIPQPVFIVSGAEFGSVLMDECLASTLRGPCVAYRHQRRARWHDCDTARAVSRDGIGVGRCHALNGKH